MVLYLVALACSEDEAERRGGACRNVSQCRLEEYVEMVGRVERLGGISAFSRHLHAGTYGLLERDESRRGQGSAAICR